MISQVKKNLYISGARLATQPETLRRLGITRVLKLHEAPPDWPDFIQVVDLPVPDGEYLDPAKLDEFVSVVQSEVERGGTMLVACGAGVSRSATVVLAYLVRSGMELPDAYRHLVEHHHRADPHPAMWESLVDYLDAPYTWLDVLQWRISKKG